MWYKRRERLRNEYEQNREEGRMIERERICMCLLYIYICMHEREWKLLFSKMMEMMRRMIHQITRFWKSIFLAYGNFSRIFRELRRVVNKWKSKKREESDWIRVTDEENGRPKLFCTLLRLILDIYKKDIQGSNIFSPYIRR